MAYENIEKLGALLKDGETAALQKRISSGEKRLAELMKKLGEMEAAAAAARAEEAARRAAEEAAKQAAEAEERAEKKAEPAQAEPKSEEKPAAKAPKEEPAKKEEPKSAEPAPEEAPKSPEQKPERKLASYVIRRADPESEKSAQGKGAPRATFRPDPRAQNGARPGIAGARPTYTNSSATRPQNGAKPGARPAFGAKPQGAGKPGMRPIPVRPVAPMPAPTQRREPTKKFEKTYVERRPVNKRALQRQQGASIGDFDEEKSGYRKARFGKKGARKETQTVRIEHAVVTSKEIPIKVLSEKLGISAVEITKRLFREGIMKTVNESVDYDNAAFIALELG
ncbi:MAG: translation initiation factor IF-2 N-terminal domain-containing protein, partial [Clostridia bacterium]|nr:translation initiation factor IF-2 N-terminal domain-containing protein [Clostridia bacterium]